MKKLFLTAGIAIIVTLVIVLGMVAACAKEVSPTTTKTTTTKTAPEAIKWDFPIWEPRGTPFFDVYIGWVNDFNKATGGRLELVPYGAGELMPTLELLEAATAGTVKIFPFCGGYYTGKSPAFDYVSQAPPYALESRLQYTGWFYGYGIEDLMAQTYKDKFGLQYVSTQSYDLYYYLYTNFPITKASDFKGKKIRTYSLMADIVTSAGGSGTWIPIEETYGALEKGTIDGVATASTEYAYGLGFHEVIKYLNYTPWIVLYSEPILVNQAAWNSLPTDLQDLLRLAWPAIGERFEAFYAIRDPEALSSMVKDWKITVNTLPQAEVDILRGYCFQALDKLSATDPLEAELTKRLKEYMTKAGLL